MVHLHATKNSRNLKMCNLDVSTGTFEKSQRFNRISNNII